MSSSSTVTTVKAQLVSLLTTALATSGVDGGQVPVDYAWPGPDTQAEHVFLGRHPDLVANPLLEAASLRSEIANIKAGRKHRTESYAVDVTIWSFRHDLGPEDAQEAEVRAFALYAELEDVLADDPALGLAIVAATVADVSVSLVPFQSGWAAVLVPTISISARLT